MADGPEWFAPKRYGYGAGMPISWQGWAVTLAYAGLVIAAAAAFHEKPVIFFAVALQLTAAFLLITARTTRGGWRWRWGKDDQ